MSAFAHVTDLDEASGRKLGTVHFLSSIDSLVCATLRTLTIAELHLRPSNRGLGIQKTHILLLSTMSSRSNRFLVFNRHG